MIDALWGPWKGEALGGKVIRTSHPILASLQRASRKHVWQTRASWLEHQHWLQVSGTPILRHMRAWFQHQRLCNTSKEVRRRAKAAEGRGGVFGSPEKTRYAHCRGMIFKPLNGLFFWQLRWHLIMHRPLAEARAVMALTCLDVHTHHSTSVRSPYNIEYRFAGLPRSAGCLRQYARYGTASEQRVLRMYVK